MYNRPIAQYKKLNQNNFLYLAMSQNTETSNKSREHLANERTFLAWIRTGIALMGFGFVIVKFALFLKQASILLAGKAIAPPKGYSAIIGIVMVALGVIMTVLAFWQYKKTMRQLNSNTYMPSSVLSALLTLAITLGGVLMLVFLLPNL